MTSDRPAGPTCTATRPPRRSRSSACSARSGCPECATPPEEVYELAKRRGMDFVTITDHDTIDGALRDRRPPRRVRLRGADRLVPRRAAGGARPLLRHHARRPRAGCRRTPTTSRRAPSTCTSSEIACALAHPFYAVEAPLDRRATAAGSRELFPVWEVAQRLARARAEHARRDLHRDPRRHRRRRLATTTPASTSAAPSPRRRAAATPRGVPRPPARRPRRRRAATRAAPPSGRTPRWRSPSARSARGEGDAPPDPRAVHDDGRARHDARATRAAGALGADLGPEDARALLRAWLRRGRARARPTRSCSPDAGRRLLATPTCSAARAARTSASSRPRSTRSLGRRDGARATAAARRCWACSTPASPAIPYAPAAAFLGTREGQARRARRRAACASRSSPTRSAACTASRTRSTRSASAACPASRSR